MRSRWWSSGMMVLSRIRLPHIGQEMIGIVLACAFGSDMTVRYYSLQN
jgi:hypothetical protein